MRRFLAPVMRHKRFISALAAAAAVLALALPGGISSRAALGSPNDRVFVPGTSLGGVRLGMTKADVLRAWGKRHGVCRDCRRTTWYFNYRPFEPQGTGVVFARGRVAHAFTLWQPDGWRTAGGLALGDDPEAVREAHAVLEERSCDGYTALVARAPLAHSVFYVYRDELWGFGLTEPAGSPCVT